MSKFTRYAASVPTAAIVTAAIIFGMAHMIKPPATELAEPRPAENWNVRVDIDDIDLPERTVPMPTQVVAPPPPPKTMPPTTSPPDAGDRYWTDDVPDYEPNENRITLPKIDENTFYQPLVRCGPVYPQSALHRELEGRCTTRFDLDTNGTPFNIIATCSNAVFEKAVIKATEGFVYRPKVEDGTPVIVRGISTEFIFKLD